MLGSVVPLLLPDSRSHYTNRSMHSSVSSPVLTLGWDNSYKPEIQAEGIMALVRQADYSANWISSGLATIRPCGSHSIVDEGIGDLSPIEKTTADFAFADNSKIH